MKKYKHIITITICLLIFWQCDDLEPASEVYYISTDRRDTEIKASDGCAFRYKLVNFYATLDHEAQQKAVNDAFRLWQRSNSNLIFLPFDDDTRCDLLVKFVEPTTVSVGKAVAPIGLVPVQVRSISSLQKSTGKTYIIALDKTFPWNQANLQKVVSYHIGLYLGMKTSADSLSFNHLYPLPCRDLKVDFLPFKLKVNSLTVRTIKIEKQGTIIVTASGIIRVGIFVGNSTPDGLLTGIFGITLASYNIVSYLNHGALLYRLDGDKTWKTCGSKCEFPTNGSSYMELSFEINSNDQAGNIGAYDVEVSNK